MKRNNFSDPVRGSSAETSGSVFGEVRSSFVSVHVDKCRAADASRRSGVARFDHNGHVQCAPPTTKGIFHKSYRKIAVEPAKKARFKYLKSRAKMM